MNGAASIQVAELVLPGVSALEGARIAGAMQRELGRLWGEDQRAGRGWRRELGAVAVELEHGLAGEALGQAIAREIRARALLGREQP